MRITIQCNQLGCKHNSEYTINNKHECLLTNPRFFGKNSDERNCASKEVETTLTTHDLLEIDEAKETQKNIPWPCTHCITEDTDYCMNICPIKKN